MYIYVNVKQNKDGLSFKTCLCLCFYFDIFSSVSQSKLMMDDLGFPRKKKIPPIMANTTAKRAT